MRFFWTDSNGVKQDPPGTWWVSFNRGGQGGIRTPERISPLHAFQACAFNRSATCPRSFCVAGRHYQSAGPRVKKRGDAALMLTSSCQKTLIAWAFRARSRGGRAPGRRSGQRPRTTIPRVRLRARAGTRFGFAQRNSPAKPGSQQRDRSSTPSSGKETHCLPCTPALGRKPQPTQRMKASLRGTEKSLNTPGF